MMQSDIQPQPGIMDIALYVSGDSRIEGHTEVLKLSSNENPFGPSQRAVEAVREAATKLHLYPDSSHIKLRQAIARVHNLDPDRIVCGAGSDEIIAFLCQTYAGPGDEVLYTEHGFAMYRISALAAGATPVEVREDNRVTDVDALLAGCNANTRLVFIANPNNPTGTMISAAEVERLAKGIPAGALLVLDGAYAEYVNEFNGSSDLVNERDNVVMTRTFSKIHGLGGLRVGWGYGPVHVIGALNRVRGPFNVSAAGLLAAAAAVQDVDYTSFCRVENARNRDWLTKELVDCGLSVDPSEANFICVRFASPALAQECDQELRRHGIVVRSIAGYNLPEALRITIGDTAACARVAGVIKDFIGNSDI